MAKYEVTLSKAQEDALKVKYGTEDLGATLQAVVAKEADKYAEQKWNDAFRLKTLAEKKALLPDVEIANPAVGPSPLV